MLGGWTSGWACGTCGRHACMDGQWLSGYLCCSCKWWPCICLLRKAVAKRPCTVLAAAIKHVLCMCVHKHELFVCVLLVQCVIRKWLLERFSSLLWDSEQHTMERLCKNELSQFDESRAQVVEFITRAGTSLQLHVVVHLWTRDVLSSCARQDTCWPCATHCRHSCAQPCQQGV